MKKKILAYARNRKGVSLIVMAGVLVALLILASLAIDIAYMYYVKNQLQVAADAAALAGAALLHTNSSDPDYTIQVAARAKAIEFAAKNTAAGISVALITDNSNTLGNNNDITVGRWDGTQYRNANEIGGTPINAIEVNPKRHSGLTGSRGPVRLFLGHIFKLIGSDWTFMEASGYAIAARPPTPTTGLVLCQPACSLSGAQLNIPFLTNNQQSSPAYSLSYTEFLLKTPVGKTTCLRNPNQCDRGLDADCATNDQKAVASYIWQLRIAPVRCGTIRWDNGVANIPSDIECAFRDTTLDANSKTIVNGKTVNWKVIVPISETCPSGSTPGQTEVSNIVQLAEIVIVDVVDSQGRSVINDSHAGSPVGIKISSIDCFSCDDWTHIGSKPALVK